MPNYCDYRHDCWHEDTCHCIDQALVKPGCWMPKGEGWKPEPDSTMVIEAMGKKPEEPKVIEPDQGELF